MGRSSWWPVAAVATAIVFVVALAGAPGVAQGAKPGPRPSPTPTAVPTPTPAPTPISVYGAWHCSNDACSWASARAMTDFENMNHWLIDRGDGKPSVNLVVLSFVNPLKLLNGTNDAGTAGGVPKGMTRAIVDYFTAHGIRVMVSIGGITYTKDWTTALGHDPTGLGLKAADLASALGVGVEIDYEEANSPDLVGLHKFIDAYRGVHPYDTTGTDPRARLTIDLAAGDRWLIGIAQKATAEWLTPGGTVLDYANAMVPSRQPSASGAIANWQEHVDGKPQYAPPIPPLAPARFTGSLYVAEGSQARPECNDFAASLQNATASYVRSVAPKDGSTAGMLGFMFWAAERPSSRGVGTQPPNTCEGGVGVGATTFAIPVPMQPLRQR